jgi:hypothetical protein
MIGLTGGWPILDRGINDERRRNRVEPDYVMIRAFA